MDQIAIDKLSSGSPGENILIGPDKITYEPEFNLTDFDLDDLINVRSAIQIFNYSSPISLPSGSPYPKTIDMTVPTYAKVPANFIAQFEILNDVFATATESTPIWDCKVTKTFDDDTRSTLISIEIWGHEDPATPGQTIDELQLIMR